MELDKILDALRRDRDSLDEAILALQRLLPAGAQDAASDSPGKRPGRPARSKNTSE